jgi:hypothetical protein
MSILSKIWSWATTPSMVLDGVLTPSSPAAAPMAPAALRSEQFADHHAEARKHVERQRELMDKVCAVANGYGNFSQKDLDDLVMIDMGVETRTRIDAKGKPVKETFYKTTEKFEPEEFDGIRSDRL